MFRELLSNADDRLASHTKVCLTKSGRYYTRLKVKNSGMPFDSESWDRLTRIAQGNDDVHATGRFGVGFFSVFSVASDVSITTWLPVEDGYVSHRMKMWLDKSGELLFEAPRVVDKPMDEGPDTH